MRELSNFGFRESNLHKREPRSSFSRGSLSRAVVIEIVDIHTQDNCRTIVNEWLKRLHQR
jgi:hypothetical protein